MNINHTRGLRWVAVLGALAGLAACAPMKPPVQSAAPPEPPTCTRAAAGDALVGNWLAVASEKGVAGAIRTLYTLNPDGTMRYVEQIKRPRMPSQGLYESGCWTREGQTVLLRTLESNGMPVNLEDPIYTNRFQVREASATQLWLRDPGGKTVRAKRMSPGYRLPF